MELKKVIEKLPVDDILIKDVSHYMSQAGSIIPVTRYEFLKEKFREFLNRKNLIQSLSENLVITNVFLDELADYIYFQHIHEEKEYITAVIDANKHKKGRTVKEKEQRSSADFRKNILPELGRDEKIHHARKKRLREK